MVKCCLSRIKNYLENFKCLVLGRKLGDTYLLFLGMAQAQKTRK